MVAALPIVITLLGQSGEAMRDLCDALICIPSTCTFEIQERNIAIYHTLYLMVEMEFFG